MVSTDYTLGGAITGGGRVRPVHGPVGGVGRAV